MIETYEQYKEARPKWLKLMEANKTKEAAEFRSRTILISGAATVRNLNHLIEVQAKRSNEIDMSSAVSVRKVKIFICLVSAILIFSSLAIAFWIARSLLEQLGGEPEYVTGVARRVADGDLTMNIGTKEADATSMLHAMKNMVSKLKGIVGRARETADHVASAGQQLSPGSERMSKGVAEQAGGALHDIVKSVNDLQSMVQQIAAAMEEMSAVSETIGGDIEKIAVFSKETSTSAGEVAKSSTDLAMLASNLQGIVTHFKIA